MLVAVSLSHTCVCVSRKHNRLLTSSLLFWYLQHNSLSEIRSHTRTRSCVSSYVVYDAGAAYLIHSSNNSKELRCLSRVEEEQRTQAHSTLSCVRLFYPLRATLSEWGFCERFKCILSWVLSYLLCVCVRVRALF